MNRFRLLKQTRQATEYSCGASSLQAVLAHWGKDIDEQTLMTLLGTTPEDGTYPEDLVRVARSVGLGAELKSGLSLDEVRASTDKGEPVLVLGQLWLTDESHHENLQEEWDCGHWFIALAVDDGYIYFEDPYVRMGKGFMPRDVFEDRWHNVMGGDRSKPEQRRMAIFIRGEKPVEPPVRPMVDFSGLEPGKQGSLNLLVARFEGMVRPLDLADDLATLLSSGMVRNDANIFLYRDAEGRVTAVEGGGVQTHEDIARINAVLGALAGMDEGREAARARALTALNDAWTDFGLTIDELRHMAEQLPLNHSAIVVLFENVWETIFRETAERHGGKITRQKLIGTDELIELGSALTTGVNG